MNAILETVQQLDYAAIKARQNAAWASGDYARIGTTLQIVGETLAESMELPPGARVLDVAAGNGNATLALARRWCEVTSTDYVDTLLARGRQRAEAEGLNVAFEVADVENLPYADGQQALEADLLALVARFDTATDGSMRVPSEYAEVVIARA